MRKRIAALVVIIAAVAIAGCSSSTSTSTSSTTTSQPSASTSSTVANSVVGTVKWVASNKAVVSALSADVAALSAALPGAVSSTNPSTVSASCQKLTTDVATAKALPLIPNSTAQQLWASALSGLSTAAQKCTDGVAKNDTAKLSQASSAITSAGGSLKNLTSTLGL